MSGPPTASDAVVLRDTPGYRGDTQLYLNWFLIGFSTLFVGMRLYARGFMVKRLGVDDLLAVLCLGCLVSLSAMEIRLVQSGSGTHIRYVSETRLLAFFNALTTQSLLYFWCVCLMRLHIAAFLPNLHNDSKLSTTVLDFSKHHRDVQLTKCLLPLYRALPPAGLGRRRRHPAVHHHHLHHQAAVVQAHQRHVAASFPHSRHVHVG